MPLDAKTRPAAPESCEAAAAFLHGPAAVVSAEPPHRVFWMSAAMAAELGGAAGAATAAALAAALAPARRVEVLAAVASATAERPRRLALGRGRALEIRGGSIGGRDALLLRLTAAAAPDSRFAAGEAARTRAAIRAAEARADALEAELDRTRLSAARQRDLVSMVSHELRTPLALVDGRARQIARLARELSADARIGARTDSIRGAVRRLVDLMDAVLAAARLEGGRIELRPEPVDLGALLREVGEATGLAYPDRLVTVEIAEGLGWPRLDPTLIRQVAQNLASNACKYSDEGGRVAIRAAREGDEVVVEVSDHGVGVPADELDRLTERFFRATTGEGRVGTGIGLHLVREFTAMHGGVVEIESEVGVGSTFRVRLPAPLR